MTFGSKLKKLRQEFQMTQLQLADRLRLSKANISKYESDLVQPSHETLLEIAKLFDVSLDYLLGTEHRVKFIPSCLGDNIRQLRREACLTQRELAEKLYRSESAVRMWELGKSEPDSDTLVNMAGIFGVSVDYLLGTDSRLPAPTIRLVEPRRIPVFGSVAAGIPLEAITDIEDYEEINPEDYPPGDYCALRIKGSSMEPRLLDGDIVIVRVQNTIEDGEVAIVMINGDEATCKKIKKTPDGIMLISTNPVFAPLCYTNREIEQLPVRIFGKVVEYRGKL